jgi:cytochrome c oxidase subunit 2
MSLLFLITARFLDAAAVAFRFIQIATLDPGKHSALQAAASQGRAIEWLYWIIFWICLAVFVLMMGALSCASTRAYAGEQREPLPLVEDAAGDRRASWVIGSVVGIASLTLFVVLILSVITGKKVQGVESNNGVTIQIKGHQWWWEVIYPNSQADQTVTTANEIHVPTGERVAIVTSSQDVIHSFWAPNITGKRDLIPGYSSAVSFQIDTPGVYRGQCAEFCGLQHAHMGFSIIAERPDQFLAWQQQQLSSAKDPTDEVTTRGRQVFLTHSCVMCHTISGTDAGSRVGPDLTHVASRETIAAGTLPNTPGALSGWILDPQRLKPGTQMPPNALSGDELQALVSYLQSLQ